MKVIINSQGKTLKIDHISERDTIESIAAQCHYTAYELGEKIRKIVNDDLQGVEDERRN